MIATTASSAMVESLKALYGTLEGINDFIDRHIEVLKSSENPTTERTGRVLEQAKIGFGLGGVTPIIAIAAGQLILGNPLGAAVTVATAPVNPVAMTCAAVGAIYYGWNALNDQEKDEITEKLSKGLNAGIQIIKSVIGFINEAISKFFTENDLKKIREFISDVAALFGRTLGDVTRKIKDRVSDSYNVILKTTGKVKDSTLETAEALYDKGAELVERVTHARSKASEDLPQLTPSTEHQIMPSVYRVKLSSEGQLSLPPEAVNRLGTGSEGDLVCEIGEDSITLKKRTTF